MLFHVLITNFMQGTNLAKISVGELQFSNSKYSNSFIEPHGMHMNVCMCIHILTLYMADFIELINFNGKTHPTSKGILGIPRGSNIDPAF